MDYAYIRDILEYCNRGHVQVQVWVQVQVRLVQSYLTVLVSSVLRCLVKSLKVEYILSY